MLFPQEINTSAKGPKWAGMQQQTGHNLSVINVSVESFLLYADEPLM